MRKNILLNTALFLILIISLIQLYLTPVDGAYIDGHVLSDEDIPLENATVELYYNSTLINTTTTDENGYFRFEELGNKSYSIRAVFNNLSSNNVDVNASVSPLGNNTGAEPTVKLIIDTSGDSDQDGLPDYWEIEHGLDPSTEDDSMEDYDGDGFSNLEEYERGTDPAEPNSYPSSPPPPKKKEHDVLIDKDSISIIVFVIISFCVILIIIGIVIAYQYSKITSKKLMSHETRQRILKHIDDQPGGHLRGIKGDLGLSMGVLTHHIGILEREEVIKSRDDGMYKRYYPYKFKIDGTTVLTGSQKKMFKAIKEKPGSTPDIIAESIGKSRKTIYYHIQELEAKGLITTDKTNGSIKCFPMQDT